jgi:subtilase family serine protease
MVVAGVNRTLNYVSYSVLLFSANLYWDKNTGVLVKATISSLFGEINVTMTATNMWSPSGGLFSPTNLIIIGAVVIVVIALAVVLSRRRK